MDTAEKRREQWRDSQKRRREHYKELCAKYGVRTQAGHWQVHYRELKQGNAAPAQGARLSKEQLQAWWTERFSMDEIREMAGALDWLSTEGRIAS
jgi:hypothetical protein